MEVTIGSRDPDRAAATAAEVGAARGLENADAVADAELVVLSVDASAALATATELAEPIGETPVLSVASELRVEQGAAYPSESMLSLAERTQELLGGPVVAGLQSLAAKPLAQVKKLVRAKVVRFRRVAPPKIDAFGPLVARADAVAPMVVVGEATARPTEIWDFDFLECRDHVGAHAVNILQLRILAYPQAIVNAAAQVLGEVAIDVAADFVFAAIHMDDECSG